MPICPPNATLQGSRAPLNGQNPRNLGIDGKCFFESDAILHRNPSSHFIGISGVNQLQIPMSCHRMRHEGNPGTCSSDCNDPTAGDYRR